MEEKKSLKEKIEEKKLKAKNRYERFQLLLSFIGAVFFVFTTFIKTRDNFKDSPFYLYIIIFTIAYLLIFVLFALIHIKNSKKLSNDTKNFKSNFKIIKLVLNLLFIGSSLLIFYDSITLGLEDAKFIEIVKTALSGLLLVVKLLTTFLKLIKNIKGQVKKVKKNKEKEEKEKAKANKKD